MRIVWRFGVVAIVASLLGACGSSSDFKQPIAGFSAATKAAAASLSESVKPLDKLAAEKNLSFALAHPNVVRTAETSDCGITGARCRLTIRYPNGARVPLTPEPVASNILKLMVALSTYAENLNSIATADSAGEIKAAMDATKASAIALAKAGDKLAIEVNPKYRGMEAQVTAYAGPLAELATFGLTKYAEHVKVEALKEATARVDTVFPTLTVLFSETAAAGLDERRDVLAEEVRQAQNKFLRDQRNRALLVAYQEKTTELDGLMIIKAGAPFAALEKAHRALVKALHSPEPNFEEAWKYLQQVIDETVLTATAIRALQKAGDDAT